MLNRRKDRKNYLKKVYVFASLIMLLMVVGYAALVRNLNINGTANITTQWDIYIQSVTRTNKTSGATETSQPSYNKLTATFNVNLSLPGDSVEYDIVIKNGGNVEAILKNINTSLAQSNTGLTYTYSGLYKNDRIAANGTKTMHLKFYWPSRDTSVPTGADKTKNLTISLNFEQSTPIAGIPILKTATTSSSEFLGHSLTKFDVESITITDSKIVPSGAIDSWDVSSANNGSIMAYTMDSNSNSKYELYIGGDGGIQANANSSYLFYDFYNVTSIAGLNNLYTDNVTNMSGMFRSCYNLASLDLSSFNTSSVTSMNNMFQNCNRLTSLDLSSFNTYNVQGMMYMFSYCSSLTSLDLSSFNTSSVQDMSYMFENCSNLTSLTLGNNFKASSVINMQNMFYNCSSLTSLDLSNFNTSSVTGMSSMFYGCGNLTSLDLSSFNTSSVANMSSMFYGCSSLTSLDLSSFNTSGVTNMGSMFQNCSNLTSLDLSSFDTSAVTNMGSMFRSCSKLTTTINITTTSSTYSRMFRDAATASGSGITVNYTSTNSSLVDSMIATKSASSNVVKGSLITS